MSCNCKKAKEISKIIINNNSNKYDKKGYKYYLVLCGDLLITILNKIIMIALFVTVIPIVSIVMLVNMCFGINSIKLPKKWREAYAQRLKE